LLKYLMISLAGFLGSYHCIGMCGFIPPLIQYRSWLLGNIMFFHNIQFQLFQKILTVFLGAGMIILGLQITGRIKEKGVPGLDLIFTAIAEILSKFRKNPFFLGMFNGLCIFDAVYV